MSTPRPVYISNGNIGAKPWWRPSALIELFWTLLNFIVLLYVTRTESKKRKEKFLTILACCSFRSLFVDPLSQNNGRNNLGPRYGGGSGGSGGGGGGGGGRRGVTGFKGNLLPSHQLTLET